MKFIGIDITKKLLDDGRTYIFRPDEMTDDYREGEIFYSKRILSYCIWFNGALIYSSKTFPSMAKRLQKLIVDWKLIRVEELIHQGDNLN